MKRCRGEKKRTLEVKMKSCKSNVFVFFAHERSLMQVRNLKAHWTIVFRCRCCQSCLHLSSLYWTSLWFILSSQCLLFASNYFPICFQTLTMCQRCTEAQMWESPDYKIAPTLLPKHINVQTKRTHVNPGNTCTSACQKIDSFDTRPVPVVGNQN